MSQESWYRKVWKIRGVEQSLAHHEVLSPDSEFWLEPFIRSGEPLFYKVRFEDGKMPAAVWKDKMLVPVGDCACTIASLPEMGSPPQPDYTVRVQDVCNKLKSNAGLKRLEGVITVNGEPEVVRFMAFPGAQSNGRDWMVIQVLKSVDPCGDGEAAMARQGGTAHGDPR